MKRILYDRGHLTIARGLWSSSLPSDQNTSKGDSPPINENIKFVWKWFSGKFKFFNLIFFSKITTPTTHLNGIFHQFSFYPFPYQTTIQDHRQTSYMTKHDHIWPYITIYKYILPKMTILYNIWPYMTLLDHTWPYMTIHDLTWPHMTKHDLTWPHMIVHGHTWPYITIHYHTAPHTSTEKHIELSVTFFLRPSVKIQFIELLTQLKRTCF